VSMVVIGYVVTFVIRSGEQGGGRFTFQELLLGFSFGVVYLFLALNDQVIFDRLPTGWAEALFFSVQCALVLGIGWVLGPGGNWAIGVPLAGFAVERLTPRRRWPVYAALIATVVLPIGLRQATWTGALLTMLINAVISGSAVFFVAAFAQMRLNEQQARQKAERLTAELEKANVQLAAYATQAEELAITQERNRLAREIHDSLGHYLTTVNVQIEAAKAVMNSDADRALDAMNKAQEMTQKGLTRVRESVAALRESPVSNRPLREAVASLVQEAQSTGIVTEFQVVGEPQTLENKVALALYRAAQEGLTNVRKHAHASRVDVLLEFQPDEVSLEIRDNGVGAEEPSGGFGLLGTRERMQLLGGRLEISTGVGKGFRLTASVPVPQPGRSLQPEE
jgi:signal transduction histidine kinase